MLPESQIKAKKTLEPRSEYLRLSRLEDPDWENEIEYDFKDSKPFPHHPSYLGEPWEGESEDYSDPFAGETSDSLPPKES